MLRWQVLAGALLTQIAIALINQGIPTLAPFLRADLGLSNFQVGLLNTFIFGGFVLAGSAMGSLSDRVGPRRVLVAGTGAAAFAIAAIAGFAPAFVVLAPMLVALGVAGVGITPAGTQAVARMFPAHQRGLAISLRQMGVPLGAALAAALLPAIALASDWRVALAVVAVLAAGAAALAWPLLRGAPEPVAERERRRGRPRRAVWIAAAAGSMLPIGQFVLITYLLLWLQDVHGIGVGFGAALLAAGNLVGAGSRVGFSAATDHLPGGRRVLLVPVVAAIAVGALVLSILPSDASRPLIAAVVLAFASVALGWQGLYFTMIAELARPGAEGRATGLAVTFTAVGIMVGPAAFGWITDVTGGYTWAWRALAAVALGGAAVLASVRETPTDATADGP